jgi:hypothetical protein
MPRNPHIHPQSTDSRIIITTYLTKYLCNIHSISHQAVFNLRLAQESRQELPMLH